MLNYCAWLWYSVYWLNTLLDAYWRQCAQVIHPLIALFETKRQLHDTKHRFTALLDVLDWIIACLVVFISAHAQFSSRSFSVSTFYKLTHMRYPHEYHTELAEEFSMANTCSFSLQRPRRYLYLLYFYPSLTWSFLTKLVLWLDHQIFSPWVFSSYYFAETRDLAVLSYYTVWIAILDYQLMCLTHCINLFDWTRHWQPKMHVIDHVYFLAQTCVSIRLLICLRKFGFNAIIALAISL